MEYRLGLSAWSDDQIWNDIESAATLSRVPLQDPWLDGYYTAVKQHTQARINYYRFLHQLVRLYRPPMCLELGVEYGCASAHMARAAFEYGGLVVGVDHEAKLVKKIAPTCSNFTFVLGDTVESARIVQQICEYTNRKIGLVFQDSSHHFDPSVEEFRAYAPLLTDKALWVCDDITHDFIEVGVDKYSMVEYFNWIPVPEARKRLYRGLHTGNRIGVAIVERG